MGVSAQDEFDFENVVEVANGWTPGDTVPLVLLEYQERGHLPLINDTSTLFYEINNYPLFMEILGSADHQQGLLKIAANRAMDLAGPNKFFADYAKDISKKADLGNSDIHQRIKVSSRNRFAIANVMSIDERNMPLAEAERVFDQVKAELGSVALWSDVMAKYQAMYEYERVEQIDGRPISLTRTRVGNGGKLITSEDRHTPFWSYHSDNDEMVKRALRADLGDIITFRKMGEWNVMSQLDGEWVNDWRFEELVLMQVIEEYDGEFPCD
jgi:hypothetical protein